MIRRPEKYRLATKILIFYGNKYARYSPLWNQDGISDRSIGRAYSGKFIVLRRSDTGYCAGIDMDPHWFTNRFRGEKPRDVEKYLCSLTPKQWKLIELECKLYGA